MEEEKEQPFEAFAAEAAQLIRKYTGTVSANDMIKAFRHLEVDLLAAMMVSIRVTDKSRFLQEHSENN